MLCLTGRNADVIWRGAARRLGTAAAVQESREEPTRELLHVSLTLGNSRQRLVFSRAMNPAFAIAEVLWIMAGGNDVRFLAFWNPRMRRYVDPGTETLHGAYGDRLGSQPHLSDRAALYLRADPSQSERPRDQLRAAAAALQHTPHSRQVVLQLWDGARDLPDPTPRASDVPCNLVSHLLVRQGRLEWLQVMRSNDLVWGLPYNLIQFTMMQEIVAGWLGLDIGTYVHISDSLHVYKRHWPMIDALRADGIRIPTNHADLRIGSYALWETLWARLIDAALELTERRGAAEIMAIRTNLTDLPEAYAQWLAVLTAEALRRGGYTSAADDAIRHAGRYWATSWRQWASNVAPYDS